LFHVCSTLAKTLSNMFVTKAAEEIDGGNLEILSTILKFPIAMKTYSLQHDRYLVILDLGLDDVTNGTRFTDYYRIDYTVAYIRRPSPCRSVHREESTHSLSSRPTDLFRRRSCYLSLSSPLFCK